MVLAGVGPGDGAGRGVAGQRRPVDVDLDAGLVAGVGAGELDGGAGLAAPAARDLELGAANVELRAAKGAGAVQANVLGAHEVVARRQVLRQLEGEAAGALAAGEGGPVDARVGVDLAAGQRVDLEPVAVALVLVGGDAVGSAREVHGLRARVSQVRVDEESDLVARRHRVGLGGGHDGGVEPALVAHHVLRLDVLDGRVGVGRPSHVLVRPGRLAVDHEGLEVVVRQRRGDEAHGGDDGGQGVAVHLCNGFGDSGESCAVRQTKELQAVIKRCRQIDGNAMMNCCLYIRQVHLGARNEACNDEINVTEDHPLSACLPSIRHYEDGRFRIHSR